MGWVSLAVRFILFSRNFFLTGSTRYSEEDINMLVNGTNEQKGDWHRKLGHELGT